ncbi:hypothetical protein Tco_0162438 [Tanacetum coccineum]
METLLVRDEEHHIYQSQESPVYLQSEGTKHASTLLIELFSDYQCEIHYHPNKANVVVDELSRKERLKPKRIQAMNMTLQSNIKSKILAAQKEASDEPAEM